MEKYKKYRLFYQSWTDEKCSYYLECNHEKWPEKWNEMKNVIMNTIKSNWQESLNAVNRKFKRCLFYFGSSCYIFFMVRVVLLEFKVKTLNIFNKII